MKCIDCMYFDNSSHYDGAWNDKGLCRRFPPVANNESLKFLTGAYRTNPAYYVQPVVTENTWCGEFKIAKSLQ